MGTVLVVVAVWLVLSLSATFLVCLLCHGGRRTDTTLLH